MADELLGAAPDEAPVEAEVAQAPPAGEFKPLEITITPSPTPRDGTGEGGSFQPLPPPKKLLSNVPGGTPLEEAAAKGTATALLKGASHIPGFAGDIRELVDFMHGGIKSLFTDKTTAEEVEASREKRRLARQSMEEDPYVGWLAKMVPPVPSGEDIYRKVVAPYLGEYHGETPLGRAGMAAIEAGTSMLGPGGVTQMAVKSPRAYEQAAAEIARKQAMRPPGAPPLRTVSEVAPVLPAVGYGTLGGGVGSIVGEATGSPLASVLAGVGVPMTAGHLTNKYMSSLADKIAAGKTTPKGVARAREQAGETFFGTAANPEKAYADIHFQPEELVPRSKPTLGEMSGDVGWLAEENRLRQARREIVPRLNEIADKQAEARRAYLDSLASNTADKLAPRDILRNRLQDVDQITQGAVDAAEAAVRAARERAPTGRPAGEVGEEVRTILQEASDQARTARSSLYRAIDPTNEMAIVTEGPARAGRRYISEFDPRYDVQKGRAYPFYEAASNLGPLTRFNDIQRLEQRITDAMSEARRAGDFNAVRELTNLKSEITGSIMNAVENQIAWEAREVASGRMLPESTIAARLREEARAFQESRRRGIGGNEPPPDMRLPPPTEPNIAPDVAERLQRAKEAHAEFAQAYRQGPTGAILRENGFRNQYVLSNANVPSRAFPAGATGYDTVTGILRNAQNNPLLVQNLADIALGALRNGMRGQPDLTQRVLDAWKTNYGPALRALDEVIPGFINQFDNLPAATRALQDATAYRTQTLNNARKGYVGKILGMTSAEELVPFMGRALSSDKAATEIGNIMSMFRNDPDAINAIRRATLEHIMKNYSGNKLAELLKQKPDALSRVFTEEQIKNFGPLLADYARKAEADRALRTRIGPTTSQNLGPMLTESVNKANKAGANVAEQAMVYLALDALQLKPVAIAAFLGKLGKGSLDKMKGAGVRNIEELYIEGILDPTVAKALMQEAVNARGVKNVEAARLIGNRLARSAEIANTIHEVDRDRYENKRAGRKSGGRVGHIDHVGKAAALVRAAEAAKKAHNSTTEPLLNHPDEHITYALSIAKKAI